MKWPEFFVGLWVFCVCQWMSNLNIGPLASWKRRLSLKVKSLKNWLCLWYEDVFQCLRDFVFMRHSWVKMDCDLQKPSHRRLNCSEAGWALWVVSTLKNQQWRKIVHPSGKIPTFQLKKETCSTLTSLYHIPLTCTFNFSSAATYNASKFMSTLAECPSFSLEIIRLLGFVGLGFWGFFKRCLSVSWDHSWCIGQ